METGSVAFRGGNDSSVMALVGCSVDVAVCSVTYTTELTHLCSVHRHTHTHTRTHAPTHKHEQTSTQIYTYTKKRPKKHCTRIQTRAKVGRKPARTHAHTREKQTHTDFHRIKSMTGRGVLVILLMSSSNPIEHPSLTAKPCTGKIMFDLPSH